MAESRIRSKIMRLVLFAFVAGFASRLATGFVHKGFFFTFFAVPTFIGLMIVRMLPAVRLARHQAQND